LEVKADRRSPQPERNAAAARISFLRERQHEPQKEALREMGFTDEVLIEVLLKKHCGDLNACLNELFH